MNLRAHRSAATQKTRIFIRARVVVQFVAGVADPVDNHRGQRPRLQSSGLKTCHYPDSAFLQRCAGLFPAIDARSVVLDVFVAELGGDIRGLLVSGALFVAAVGDNQGIFIGGEQ